MMKKLFLICVFILGGKIFSQSDTLFRNKQIYWVKVTFINQDTIRYKLADDTTGTIYSVSYSEFDRLVLSNGTKIIPAIKISKTLSDFKRHYVGTNMNQILFSTFSISYQHIFKNGKWGIRIPLSYNLNPWMLTAGNITDYPSISERKYTAGLECNFYPFGQRRFSYFTGGGFQMGMYDYVSSDYTFANQTTYPYLYPPDQIKHDGLHTSFVFNQGVMYRITKCFWTDAVIGFGMQRNYSPKAGEEIKQRASFQLNLGLSF